MRHLVIVLPKILNLLMKRSLLLDDTRCSLLFKLYIYIYIYIYIAEVSKKKGLISKKEPLVINSLCVLAIVGLQRKGLTIQYYNIRTDLATKTSGKGELQISKVNPFLRRPNFVAPIKATSAYI